MRVVRRPVTRQGQRPKDGGIACVMPVLACRQLGAEVVIASDVWEFSSLLRRLGCHPTDARGRRVYPGHYLTALRHTDLLIQPAIPARGYFPGSAAIERMIAVGEAATRIALGPVWTPAASGS
jgi:hypothetical protein